MKKGLRIYGGFASTETNRAQRNWATNVVVLHSLSPTTAPIIATPPRTWLKLTRLRALLDSLTLDGANAPVSTRC